MKKANSKILAFFIQKLRVAKVSKNHIKTRNIAKAKAAGTKREKK